MSELSTSARMRSAGPVPLPTARVRVRARRLVGRIALYFAVMVSTLVMLAPIYWMFSRSLMLPEDVQSPITIYVPSPMRLTLANYYTAFVTNPYLNFGVATINSTIYTVGVVAGAMLFSGTGAYVLAKKRFKGDTIVLMAIVSTMMIPSPLVLIPNFLILVQLGWVNTFQGLIVPHWGAGLGLFMMRQYMLSIPDELLDAARIDGAGEPSIFARIVVPLSAPILISYGLLETMWTWNGIIWPLIVTSSRNMLTLPVALINMREQDFALNWGATMAGGAIASIPILVLFLLGQRYLVGGLLAGALKE